MVNDLADLKCEDEEAGGRGKWDLWVWAPSMKLLLQKGISIIWQMDD